MNAVKLAAQYGIQFRFVPLEGHWFAWAYRQNVAYPGRGPTAIDAIQDCIARIPVDWYQTILKGWHAWALKAPAWVKPAGPKKQVMQWQSPEPPEVA